MKWLFIVQWPISLWPPNSDWLSQLNRKKVKEDQTHSSKPI